jgi:hypothetical protein
MQVTVADQDQVKDGIRNLKGLLTSWYIDDKISRPERDEAFIQLQRIDKVCNERSQNN